MAGYSSIQASDRMTMVADVGTIEPHFAQPLDSAVLAVAAEGVSAEALRAAVDPWGPVAAGTLALMRGLRDEFDPRGVLNPGRFVGGL